MDAFCHDDSEGVIDADVDEAGIIDNDVTEDDALSNVV